VIKEEIRAVVWECDGGKSPGPDGFNFNFLNNNWGTMMDDIVKAVGDFYKHEVWPKGTDASLIIFILLKKENPLGLGEYRPISLVGSIYKIISKILATRLKDVLHKFIDSK